MDRCRLAIIIPAYNESTTIARIVQAVSTYGTPIIVDDGSTDQTAYAARDAGAEVVSHVSNSGYDAALDSGFRHANRIGCDFALTMDADGQHDPSLLPVFIAALNGGADVVIGVRDRRQRIAEHVFALVSHLLWGIRDPLCGMKAYRMELYRELGHFDVYCSIGTELAIYGARRHKNIIQVAMMTQDRADSPRFGRRFNANLKIIRALYKAF